MQVHEFDTRQEAMDFAHDNEGDKTLEQVDGKWKLYIRDHSAVHRVTLEGPDEPEEEKEEEQEEQEEQEVRSDQES